jgi:hypothetical protein
VPDRPLVFKRLALIGVGLIGSSIARAALAGIESAAAVTGIELSTISSSRSSAQTMPGLTMSTPNARPIAFWGMSATMETEVQLEAVAMRRLAMLSNGWLSGPSARSHNPAPSPETPTVRNQPESRTRVPR